MSTACSNVTRESPTRIVPSSATGCPSTESSTSPGCSDAVERAARCDAVDDDAAALPFGSPRSRRYAGEMSGVVSMPVSGKPS